VKSAPGVTERGRSLNAIDALGDPTGSISDLPTAAFALDFVCEFRDQHVLVGKKPESLQSERRTDQEQFTFTIPASCGWEGVVEGKYLNSLGRGEVSVLCNALPAA
jgi:hypothetical protein